LLDERGSQGLGLFGLADRTEQGGNRVATFPSPPAGSREVCRADAVVAKESLAGGILLPVPMVAADGYASRGRPVDADSVDGVSVIASDFYAVDVFYASPSMMNFGEVEAILGIFHVFLSFVRGGLTSLVYGIDFHTILYARALEKLTGILRVF
jgi:hypothetical protein